jgi:hypothetical protein
LQNDKFKSQIKNQIQEKKFNKMIGEIEMKNEGRVLFDFKFYRNEIIYQSIKRNFDHEYD